MAMATATAISGRVAGEASAILAPSASFLPAPLRRAPCSKKGEYALICLSAIFTLMCYVYLLTDTGHSVQTHFCAFPRGAPSNLMLKPGRLCLEHQICLLQRSSTTSALSRGDFSPVTQDVEGFLHSVVNMGFLDRLKLAWKIIFPAPTIHENTNASIAKQRLKMILFSDRCEISDEAKKKIVENVVEALSEFVEIESRDSVQVDISTDAGLGTVYSVTVPVRRVKPEYQESEEQYRGKIVGVDFKDTGESSGNVDVTFDFYVPSENP